MQGRIIFLLEEPSMKVLLDGLLPRLFPGLIEHQHFLCIPHEGKSDLDKSIPRKLMSWHEPDARFVIVRDNDNADCIDIKARLQKLCTAAGRPETLIRLVCQELESWYLGDLLALAAAYNQPKINTPALQKRYRVPDDWHKPSVEIKRHIATFRKTSGARAMAQHLGTHENRSTSFNQFIQGVRRIAGEMGYPETIQA
ncbi:MAG: DUF4276 family protein [Atribacterota bacterium]|jgi:hypothetical protein|nr:DUF4276 family protein [Atribacterota bacterium]